MGGLGVDGWFGLEFYYLGVVVYVWISFYTCLYTDRIDKPPPPPKNTYLDEGHGGDDEDGGGDGERVVVLAHQGRDQGGAEEHHDQGLLQLVQVLFCLA